MTLPSDVTFTWYGHACFEVKTPKGKTLLLDPWFGNPKSTRGASTVTNCDVLLVTHAHGDHVGEAFDIAKRTAPKWPAINEFAGWARSLKSAGAADIVGFNFGGTVEVEGIKVTLVPALHSGGEWNDAIKLPAFLGEAAGFLVELENGYRFYFAGDTDVFGDMRLIGERFAPRAAFLPIGGHYTMDPRGAALAADMLGVSDVVPMHYGTFPLLAGTPAQLEVALAERGKSAVTVHAPEPGQRLR
jgi:L-ascorbate metabolism protein UlaG (beta-lactamase superfamily)